MRKARCELLSKVVAVSKQRLVDDVVIRVAQTKLPYGYLARRLEERDGIGGVQSMAAEGGACRFGQYHLLRARERDGQFGLDVGSATSPARGSGAEFWQCESP